MFQLCLFLLWLPCWSTAFATPWWGIPDRAQKLSASTELKSNVASTLVSPENLAVLSDRGRQVIQDLIDYDVDMAQSHVLGEWPPAGVEDEGKQRLAEQVRTAKEKIPA